MLDEGDVGGCNDKIKENQDQVILDKKEDKQKCKNGNRNYCPGWDNWAWKNIPSAIIYHKGLSLQGGFGGEFGGYREVGYVYNWRSLEADQMYTKGRFGYMGTPQLIGGGFYKGITLVYGASSNNSIAGNSSGGGITGSLDGGVMLGGTYEKSIAVDEDGLMLIDRVSSSPIQSYQISLNVGGNLFGNLADAGGILSEGKTQMGAPTGAFDNLIYDLLSIIP